MKSGELALACILAGIWDMGNMGTFLFQMFLLWRTCCMRLKLDLTKQGRQVLLFNIGNARSDMTVEERIGAADRRKKEEGRWTGTICLKRINWRRLCNSMKWPLPTWGTILVMFQLVWEVP
ncbi:hypothetical protein IGI04_011057 [Brassica rapa subsp. trilocularis]|uniref:Uncharacterized protein n=1 Tax=Brassica rapa subsp. trilocularis TaxID=1813537 RepID=A0ABQ7N2V6_BRACM|nr:hypothetical protein IGI04_011057 [Brassica rapa subsp. trilocularis]